MFVHERPVCIKVTRWVKMESKIKHTVFCSEEERLSFYLFHTQRPESPFFVYHIWPRMSVSIVTYNFYCTVSVWWSHIEITLFRSSVKRATFFPKIVGNEFLRFIECFGFFSLWPSFRWSQHIERSRNKAPKNHCPCEINRCLIPSIFTMMWQNCIKLGILFDSYLSGTVQNNR